MFIIEKIATVFAFLSLLALVVGLIKPSLTFQPNRKRALLIYGGVLILSAITGSYSHENTAERATQKGIIHEAEKYLAAGKYEQALEKAKEAKKVLDDYNADEIIEKCNNVIQSDKNFNTGLGLYKSGKFIEAIDKLKQVSEVDVKNYKKATEYIDLSGKAMNNIYKKEINQAIHASNLPKANDLTNKALSLNPNDPDLYAVRGIINLDLFYQSKEFNVWNQAFKAFQQDTKIQTEKELENVIKQLKQKNEQADDALKVMEKGINGNSDRVMHCNFPLCVCCRMFSTFFKGMEGKEEFCPHGPLFLANLPVRK